MTGRPKPISVPEEPTAMSQHTPSSRRSKPDGRCLPQGRAKLRALEVAVELLATLQQIDLPRGLCHLRDHLTRAADNTALRLSEGSGRTRATATSTSKRRTLRTRKCKAT